MVLISNAQLCKECGIGSGGYLESAYNTAQCKPPAGSVKDLCMKEFIYSRNAVYEALRARRRQFFRLEVSHGVQEKSRLIDILQMAEGGGHHEKDTLLFERGTRNSELGI